MEGAREALPPAPPRTAARVLTIEVDRQRVGLLLPFALSRVVLVLLTLVVAVIHRRAPLDLWNVWDGRWYTGIAAHGYHWGIHGKPALAFFPLYPLLIRLGTGLDLSGIAAGILIANVAFAAATFYLYRWTAEEMGEPTARRTVWLVTFLPTAYFFFAPYSESLALLCAVAAMYHARRAQPLPAGLWLAGAILTRPTGIIALPAVLACLSSGPALRRRPATPFLIILPAVLAIGGYLWYLSTQHVALSTLLTAQRDWHRGLSFPWMGFTESIHWLIVHGGNIPWATENLLQLAVTVAFLGLTVVAWRDLDLPCRLYCLGFWAVVLMSSEWRDGYYAPFSSMDRFVLMLFPLFAWVAWRVPASWSKRGLVLSALAMLGAAAVHLAGGWVG